MKIHCFFVLGLFVLGHPAFPQVAHNSKRFEVKDYIALDNSGKYELYCAHGFAETVVSGTPRIFIMPILELDLKSIKYINPQGNETTASNDIKAITIPITANLALPNESQKAAIGAALNSGSSLPFYYPPF